MTEKDIFRETPVRYLGYTNEVGESFRPIVKPRLVTASYIVAGGYVLADAAYKTAKTVQRGAGAKEAVKTGADVLIWQSLASVAIPGFVINRICKFTLLGVMKAKVMKKSAAKWMTVTVGLASIPFIIHPIDRFVDFCMDRSYRVFTKDL